MTKIEHINMTVPDIDHAIRFLSIVAPDFSVRQDQKPPDSYRWVHIGNEEYYFTLQQAHLDTKPQNRRPAYKNYGINHVALIVPELAPIEVKLKAAGFAKGISTPSEKHRKRAYYYDDGGFEWEMVEYLSDKFEEKYLYE